MSTKQERRLLRDEIERRLRTESPDQVAERVEEIHIEYHDDALVHMQVHRWRFRIARQQRRFGQMLLEILAVPFTAPVSWTQRYLGLALASRMNRPPR